MELRGFSGIYGNYIVFSVTVHELSLMGACRGKCVYSFYYSYLVMGSTCKNNERLSLLLEKWSCIVLPRYFMTKRGVIWVFRALFLKKSATYVIFSGVILKTWRYVVITGTCLRKWSYSVFPCVYSRQVQFSNLRHDYVIEKCSKIRNTA